MRGRSQTLCNLDTPQNLIFFLGFQKQHKTWCSVLSEPVEGSTHFFKGTAWEQRELGNTDPRVFVYLLAFFFSSKILTLQTSSLVNPFFCYHHFLDFYSRLQTEYPHGVKGRVVMESRPWGCRRAEPIPLLHAFPPSCSTFLVLHLLPFKTQIMDIGFSIQNRSAGFHDEQTSYMSVYACLERCRDRNQKCIHFLNKPRRVSPIFMPWVWRGPITVAWKKLGDQKAPGANLLGLLLVTGWG